MTSVRSAVKLRRQPGGAVPGTPGTPRTPDLASPPRLPLDRSLFSKLVRVVNLTARPFVETLLRSHQLSLNEWRVMVVLASHPGVVAREIADSTGPRQDEHRPRDCRAAAARPPRRTRRPCRRAAHAALAQ